MNANLKKTLGALAIAALGSTAHAVTVSTTPSVNAVSVGTTFSVSVDIADLIDSGAPSLGAFDLDIHFDAAVLNYTGFSWGDSVHGDQLDLAQLGSFNGYDISSASTGVLNFYEISLDDSALLNSAQAGDFGLLTLIFAAVNAGSNVFSLSVNALSDVDGNNLTAQIANGSVTVNAVPLPSTLPLFASALLLSVGGLRNRP